MQKLPAIKTTYDWFFAHYKAETELRAASNDSVGLEQMETRRDVLERGIFVLMFGQFELAVKAVFDQAISKRATHLDWKHRRGWDSPSLRGRKVPFATQLAMVLDSQLPEYDKILQTYEIRNHCAHGGTMLPVSSIDALEADLYRWQSALRS